MPVSDFMTVFFLIIKNSTLFSERKGRFWQIIVDEKIAEKVGFGRFFYFFAIATWSLVKGIQKIQMLL